MVFASMQKLVCLVLLLPAAYALPWDHAERAEPPAESTKKNVPLSTGIGAHTSKRESQTTHRPERTPATEYIVKVDNTAVATIVPDAERPRTITNSHFSHSRHLRPTGMPPRLGSSVKVEYIEVVSGKPVETVTDRRELPPPFGNRAQATEHESSSHMTPHPTLKARAEPSTVPLSEEASLIRSELSSLYSLLGFPIPRTSTKKTTTTSSKNIVATGTSKSTSTSRPLTTAARPLSTAKLLSTNKAVSTSNTKKEESTTKKEESTTKAASTTPPPTSVKVVTTTVVISGTTHTETKSA